MCPFCFAEYPPQAGSSHRGGSAAGRRKAMAVHITWSPTMKRGVIGLIVVLGAGYMFINREPNIPTNEVVANILVAPMSVGEAAALVQRVKVAAKVDVRDADIAVTFPQALWSEKRSGQLAMAQQYARAVAIVEGKSRNITFYDPAGVLYARADAAGVVMVR